jgi:hypothetical protein
MDQPLVDETVIELFYFAWRFSSEQCPSTFHPIRFKVRHVFLVLAQGVNGDRAFQRDCVDDAIVLKQAGLCWHWKS